MRIGVVSDTHNHLANVARIVDIFNRAAVERVVHTGDITQAKTLEVLARLDAPLVGVFGNNDVGERVALEDAAKRLGMRLDGGPLELELHHRRIVVVHDPRELENVLRGEHDIALHGHTHRHTLDRVGATLRFNPGECAGHVAGLNAVGVLDLDSLEVEILRF